MQQDYVELQCDGLVGPTHHYAGLSHGNVASKKHAHHVSYPKKAALQGLKKMKFVADLGIPQWVVPPHPRPNLALLEQLGFRGEPQEMLEDVWNTDPNLLGVAYSASSMWTANMATVSPAADTGDGRLHLTPANLASTLHRHQEGAFSYALLKQMFGNNAKIHSPLPACGALTDEGAANHMRFCGEHGQAGVEVFVYGKAGKSEYPARQSQEAGKAIARFHRLPKERTVFVQQTPEAIDAGVFHNDVIAMSNENLLIYHEKAFVDTEAFLEELQAKLAPTSLEAICISESMLSLEDAVASYFFNSQLLSLPEGGMVILAPEECQENPAAHKMMEQLKSGNSSVREVHYLSLRESMQNGGGPACLRLRVPIACSHLAMMPRGFALDDSLYELLCAWVEQYYPETLILEQLTDVALVKKLTFAFRALEAILPVGKLYQNFKNQF